MHSAKNDNNEKDNDNDDIHNDDVHVKEAFDDCNDNVSIMMMIRAL